MRTENPLLFSKHCEKPITLSGRAWAVLCDSTGVSPARWSGPARPRAPGAACGRGSLLTRVVASKASPCAPVLGNQLIGGEVKRDIWHRKTWGRMAPDSCQVCSVSLCGLLRNRRRVGYPGAPRAEEESCHVCKGHSGQSDGCAVLWQSLEAAKAPHVTVSARRYSVTEVGLGNIQGTTGNSFSCV
ncbi:hypothetical protein Y1Q_0019562 [Alligator mississippiensis]|uniref:Uncharacterized protein n=1 Tax=Alligator mississippiensis TaxID=8496 RepID=A0A151MM87_ALLMI|nr:hypothetical protein Y1Q_0019562 [Alligator mississippiensis]